MNSNLFHDLESYHAWAMSKVFGLCKSIGHEGLNATLPMGIGSLITTLQHIAAAEQLWLDRWRGYSSGTMPNMPSDIAELESKFHLLARERTDWFQSNRKLFEELIIYRDLKGMQHQNILGDLVLHVLNHGVHHRAQALQFLKRLGITGQGGLDYIFYRIAMPTLAIREEAAEGCRHWGLEVGSELVQFLEPDLESLLQYSEYGDWAIGKVFDHCGNFNEEQLDRDWGMGSGTIRKSLLHVYDAECFWHSNWLSKHAAFPCTPVTTSIETLASLWTDMSKRRIEYIRDAGRAGLGKAVSVNFGSGPLEFRFSESVVQLAVHGTHHRSQVLNMIRSTGKTPDGIDLVVWLRQK